MILQHSPPLHLTYCLNIHPGESWAENFAAIREKALAVKQRVAPDQWFGIGLRIAHQAAEELTASADLRAEALDFFSSNHLYPFSINGFPYGRFHAGPVKEDVYAPDWRTPERLHYTLQLADLLAVWLPEQVDGSISTVPCSFKAWIQTPEDVLAMVENLTSTVAYLAAVHEDTGREIHLGLEPEPDCYLETTAETIAFFKNVLFTSGAIQLARLLKCYRSDAEALIRRHLGVCFDTCHVALQYEDLVKSCAPTRRRASVFRKSSSARPWPPSPLPRAGRPWPNSWNPFICIRSKGAPHPAPSRPGPIFQRHWKICRNIQIRNNCACISMSPSSRLSRRPWNRRPWR